MLNNKKRIHISVIITSFEDDIYLDKLLNDLKLQNYPTSNFEILILDAGNYGIERAKEKLGHRSSKLKFFSKNKFPRTCSLNFLVSASKNDLIIRLDSRTKINKSYLYDIVGLANKKSYNKGFLSYIFWSLLNFISKKKFYLNITTFALIPLLDVKKIIKSKNFILLYGELVINNINIDPYLYSTSIYL